MRFLWPAVLLAVPFATGAVGVSQDATVDATSQDPFVTLSAGDVGTTTLGTSATSADISVAVLPLLVADDVLDLTSTDSTWNVHAELVSFTSFGLLEEITLSLRDGTVVEEQIAIAGGVASRSEGIAVDIPTSQDTELIAIGAGTGSVTFDLVIEPDAGSGPVLRYRCTLTA